uniref:Uncharacterized protein n=1 Tax=Fusarium oxysporum (strain Fo5176) TaxID=660025 RepID=A0A0D2XQV6_FUSOF
MSPRSKSIWLALLAVNSFAYAIEEPPAVTTAPIYLPYYDEDSWSLVRGSVISSCNLQGTTRATCSGYSSFNEGYNDGVHTGPTEVTWTSTYSGSEVEWGCPDNGRTAP